jgi:hypothetical protein
MAALQSNRNLVISFHTDPGLGQGMFLNGFQKRFSAASSIYRAMQLAGPAARTTV